MHNVPHLNEVLCEPVLSSEGKAQLSKLQEELLDLNTAKISYETQCEFLESQIEEYEKEVLIKENEIQKIVKGSLKEREVLERLKFLLEKQEIEFEKEKIKLNEENRRIGEKCNEERRIRTELEKEIEGHKELWARNKRTEQQALMHLNELIEKSGGLPVEIPENETSFCVDMEIDFVQSLVFHIESEVCVKAEYLGEWKDVSGKIAGEYKRNLQKLQEMYFNRIESLSERLVDDKRKINEILDSHRGADSRFKFFN